MKVKSPTIKAELHSGAYLRYQYNVSGYHNQGKSSQEETKTGRKV